MTSNAIFDNNDASVFDALSFIVGVVFLVVDMTSWVMGMRFWVGEVRSLVGS